MQNPFSRRCAHSGPVISQPFAESGQARSDIWDSPSDEVRRATANNSALERKTVRSGFAYDINGGGGSTESSERARRLKEELGNVPVTGIEGRVAYRFLKRAFDIVFSAVVLVVFCWLFAIIAILIKVDDPKGPVFFSQERVGKDGRTFRMLKFRSMCVDAEDKLVELRELNREDRPGVQDRRGPAYHPRGQVAAQAVARRVAPVHQCPALGYEHRGPASRIAG